MFWNYSTGILLQLLGLLIKIPLLKCNIFKGIFGSVHYLYFFIIADFYIESVFRINIVVYFNKSDFVVLSGHMYRTNCCVACRTESF